MYFADFCFLRYGLGLPCTICPCNCGELVRFLFSGGVVLEVTLLPLSLNNTYCRWFIGAVLILAWRDIECPLGNGERMLLLDGFLSIIGIVFVDEMAALGTVPCSLLFGGSCEDAKLGELEARWSALDVPSFCCGICD